MMYRISSLEEISSARYLVHLEDAGSFPLYKKEAVQYGITEGGFLSEAACREILEELLPKRACQRAMYLLQKMDRTELQLRRKLEESFYPGQIVDHAVAYVKRFHYIDDVRYAWNYIDSRKGGKSRRQLAAELREKGVSREDIEEALSESEFPDEREQILSWIEKKHFDAAGSSPKEKQRFCQFLMRRGFSLSAIRSALEPD